jgi:hypothetical protein
MLIPLLLFFLLAELIARSLESPHPFPVAPPAAAIDPAGPNPYIVPLRPYLYAHIPGASYWQARPCYQVPYTINALGFRGNEVGPEKPAGQKRLLVIGDSIVEGYGNVLTDTFVALLGQALIDSGWTVVNVGVQGASPIYFAANVERYLALRPDAVLIIIYENDIFEDRVREAEYFGLPYFDDTNRWLGSSTGPAWLSSSRFLTVINREWQKVRDTPVEQIARQNRAGWPASQEQIALFRRAPEVVPATFIDQQWAMSQPYLDYLVGTLRQNQVQVLLANLSIHAMQPNSPFADHARHLDQRISEWSQTKHLPFFSLLPAFVRIYEQEAPAKIIIECDTHPTPYTNRLIAASLRSWLWPQLGLK